MANKQAHLEIIQGVVNRLSHDSFLIKGWSVVLVSAFFVLAGNNSNPFFAVLAFLPGLVFWGLDGYFLWQERLFRKLYDHVREKQEADIDFAMDVSIVKEQVKPWHEVTVSTTLLAFHGAVTVSILAVTIYLFATRACV